MFLSGVQKYTKNAEINKFFPYLCADNNQFTKMKNYHSICCHGDIVIRCGTKCKTDGSAERGAECKRLLYGEV